jgi:mono/diheme cytochrome c family protein
MSLPQPTPTSRTPWLLAGAVIWILILFLKSIEPSSGITPRQPAATPIAAAVITTIAPLTATVPVTATGLVTTGIATATTTTATTNTVTTTAPVASGAQSKAAAKGKAIFATTCAACHGPNGEGVKGLGKDMTTSEFIASLSDQDLLTFIKQGRAPGDPLNTTGVMMPPKGGNPTLDDAKIIEIIAFVRAIQKR